MTNYIIVYYVKGYSHSFTFRCQAENVDDAKNKCLTHDPYAIIECVAQPIWEA